jgi:type I restriction enzyme R subunit
VQALSRLNRSAPKLGKKTENLFILDFANDIEDIKAAFDPFYTSTTLSEATDVNVLHDLKDALDESGIYEWSEIEEFNQKFFTNASADELSPLIDTAAHRFNHELELDDDTRADIKVKAKHFVKVYGQISSILEFDNIRWEQLFWFLKFLIPKMVVRRREDEILDELLESVDLSTYGIERTRLNERIQLDPSGANLDPTNANPRSAHVVDEKAALDEIIKQFNDRWFADWDATSEDKRQFFQTFIDKIQQHPDFETKYKNNPDAHTRELAYEQILKDTVHELRKLHLDFAKKWIDEHFKRDFKACTQRAIGMGR